MDGHVPTPFSPRPVTPLRLWRGCGALAAVAAILLSSACDYFLTLPATPDAVEVSPSAIESDAVGDTFELTIRVLDERGREINDFRPNVASTNQNVVQLTPEQAAVTVGNGNGTLRVIAASVFATVWVEVLQIPVQAEAVSGNGQQGEPGEPLALPLVVELHDRLGSPAAGVEVTFQVAAGGGQVDPATVVTGSGGTASTTWILGSEPGAQRVDAVPTQWPALTVPFQAETQPTP